MTRINCIPPADLVNKHLLAEYRELPRVFKLARENANIPSKYTMGPGHVTFFYDKLGYLYSRQKQIVQELTKRGFSLSFDPESLKDTWFNQKSVLWGQWSPSKQDQQTNIQRINERLADMQRKTINV